MSTPLSRDKSMNNKPVTIETSMPHLHPCVNYTLLLWFNTSLLLFIMNYLIEISSEIYFCCTLRRSVNVFKSFTTSNGLLTRLLDKSYVPENDGVVFAV